MINFPTKTDGISTEPGAEYNSLTSELKSILSSFGITPDVAQTDQIAKAIASYGLTGRYFSESGAADAYVLTAVPNTRAMPSTYLTGMIVEFIAGNANTGASTINVSGLGAKNIKRADGTTALSAGEIVTTGLTKLWYDGTNFRMQSSGQQIVPLATGDVRGLEVSHAVNSVTAAAGSCRDSADAVNLVSAGMTKLLGTAWAAGNGNGGLFSGAVGNSTTYYFFAIYKTSDGTVDFGFDTSVTAANKPVGYGSYRRLATFRTDGAATILPVKIFGNARQRQYRFDGAQSVLAAGTQTSFTDIVMTGPMSPQSTFAYVQVYSVGGISHNGVLRPNGSAVDDSGTPAKITWGGSSNNSTSNEGTNQIWIATDASQTIEYKLVAGTNVSVFVIGFMEFI